MREIPLNGAKAAGRVALVDDEDYDLVMQYRWHVREFPYGHLGNGPYAHTTVRFGNGKRANVRMHSLVMGGRPHIDHVDRVGLNNQKFNLRHATRTQNRANCRPHGTPGKSSPYKGVYWNTRRRRWIAQVGVNGKKIRLGAFTDEVAAALAYNSAASEAFGEYAYLNQITEAA